MSPDWPAIAERIRGLIRVARPEDVPRVAERLGVTEYDLRRSMDERRPFPTLAVVQALVRVYGLDPTWVLRGEYDAETHRLSLEHPETIPSLVRRIATTDSPRSVAREQSRRL